MVKWHIECSSNGVRAMSIGRPGDVHNVCVNRSHSWCTEVALTTYLDRLEFGTQASKDEQDHKGCYDWHGCLPVDLHGTCCNSGGVVEKLDLESLKVNYEGC